MRRSLRRSYEAGHNPKLLVLVDEMEDCGKAVYYASRRATRIGGKILLLRVIEPPLGELGWLGVADVVQTEARREAQELLDRYVVLAQSVAAELPESVIRQGDPAREIFELIETDEDIAVLVLAAGEELLGIVGGEVVAADLLVAVEFEHRVGQLAGGVEPLVVLAGYVQ